MARFTVSFSLYKENKQNKTLKKITHARRMNFGADSLHNKKNLRARNGDIEKILTRDFINKRIALL